MSIPREIQTLLDTSTLASLGPECRADALSLSECQAALNALDLHPRQQPLIHSALLLWHDHLDASHDLSQNISSADGSFLHGIMHRREPDYSNAKYWFRKVGSHPIHADLAQWVRASITCEEVTDRLDLKNWSPDRFVDLCEDYAASQGEVQDALKAIAAAEWYLLFNYCLLLED